MEIMNQLFCGIDCSFSGTAIVILDSDGKVIQEKLISTKANTSDQYDIEKRMLKIVEELSLIKDYPDIKLTYIEEISFGSTGSGADQLAALNYYIRVFMYQNDIVYYTVPPTTLKKYITGSGQCKKNLMLKEVYKKWNVDYVDDNLCDAYSLSRFALDNYVKGTMEPYKKKVKEKKIKGEIK
jgi:crossover junction endodeoxyribonuclease RuvC